MALAACGADSSGATGPSQSPPSHSRPVGPAEDHGLASVESYYPGTDTWVTKAGMPTARYDLAATKRDNVLFAVGGSGYMTAYTTTEAYTP